MPTPAEEWAFCLRLKLHFDEKVFLLRLSDYDEGDDEKVEEKPDCQIKSE